MKTVRLIAINLAVLGVMALLAIGAVEAYLRLTIPESSHESIFRYTLETKRYKVMRANASITAWGKELRTNSLGFRDSGPSVPAKEPGEFRIVVLGDSFTVSAGVDYDRIWTSQLERMLRAHHPEARVINLAVSGYNIVQYELVLHEVALALQPDMILVATFPANDFNNETIEGNLRRARGEPEPPAPGFPRNLYVWQAYLGRIEAKIKNMFVKAESKAASTRDPIAPDWEENINALGRIAETARKAGLPVLVTALPHTWHFSSERALHDRVYRYCEERGIPSLDLLQAFVATGVKESSLRLNPLDSHPNEAYNQIAARALAGRLEEALVRPAGSAQASRVALPR